MEALDSGKEIEIVLALQVSACIGHSIASHKRKNCRVPVTLFLSCCGQDKVNNYFYIVRG